MKNFLRISVLSIFSFVLLTACNKEPESTTISADIVGTWNVSDGGTVTFNANKTGISNAEIFTVESFTETLTEFTWTADEVEGIITMDYQGESSSATVPYLVESYNAEKVVLDFFGFTKITLTK